MLPIVPVPVTQLQTENSTTVEAGMEAKVDVPHADGGMEEKREVLHADGGMELKVEVSHVAE